MLFVGVDSSAMVVESLGRESSVAVVETQLLDSEGVAAVEAHSPSCCNLTARHQPECAVGFRGWWCRPGKHEGSLEVLVNGRVVFNGCQPHGVAAFSATLQGQPILILAFHHAGDCSKMKPKLMYQICAKVWLDAEKHCALVDSSASPMHPGGLPPWPLGACDMSAAFGLPVLRRFLWYHPGRDIGFLHLLQDHSVMWCSGDGRSKTPQPTGVMKYYADDDVDYWLVKFHSSGDMSRAHVSLLFKRLGHGVGPLTADVWRVCGTSLGNAYDDLRCQPLGGEDLWKVAKYHIVMVALS